MKRHLFRTALVLTTALVLSAGAWGSTAIARSWRDPHATHRYAGHPTGHAGSHHQMTHAPARSATEQRDVTPLLGNLGSHQHPITTSSALAQQYFNEGLTLTFGFNHAEAVRSFTDAAELDAGCSMCYWGIALALGPNINAPMDDAAAALAYAAIQRAQGDRQTLMGVAGAAGVGVLGDLVHLAAPFMGASAVEPARYAGTILIALSSALLTAGLLGVLVDTLRIYPSVVDPPLALEDVLAEPHRPAGAGT